MGAPKEVTFPVSRMDFWLTLLMKTVESALLMTQLFALLSNGSPEHFCSCVSTDGHVIPCEEGAPGAHCEGIFYRTAEALLVSSVAVSFLQWMLAVLSVPVHQLHFLGLTFFQFVAGTATCLNFFYWDSVSHSLTAEGSHFSVELCTLSLLQLLYFVFCFRRTYNHVFPTAA